jgi:hypothetical protein
MQCESYAKTELWSEYRRAFDEFARKVRRVQSLLLVNPGAEAIFTATLELEEARMMYRRRRDSLAGHFLGSRHNDVAA